MGVYQNMTRDVLVAYLTQSDEEGCLRLIREQRDQGTSMATLLDAVLGVRGVLERHPAWAFGILEAFDGMGYVTGSTTDELLLECLRRVTRRFTGRDREIAQHLLSSPVLWTYEFFRSVISKNSRAYAPYYESFPQSVRSWYLDECWRDTEQRIGRIRQMGWPGKADAELVLEREILGWMKPEYFFLSGSPDLIRAVRGYLREGYLSVARWCALGIEGATDEQIGMLTEGVGEVSVDLLVTGMSDERLGAMGAEVYARLLALGGVASRRRLVGKLNGVGRG